MSQIKTEEKKLKLILLSIIEDIQFNIINHNKIISSAEKLMNFGGKYTSKLIIQEIINNYNLLTKYEFFYKTNKISINYYHKNKITLHDSLDILFLAIKGLCFISVANKKNIDIIFNYCPTDFKKKLTQNVIGPNNVNSGFTTFYSSSPGFISIYRKEEAHKVFIHELIHYLKLDFSRINCQSIHNSIENDFSINSPKENINLFEAYTDSMAIIYNTIINAILTKDISKNVINYEVSYQYNLINSLLNELNITHIVNDLNTSAIKLKQTSNVLSYYFLKYGAMKNVNMLLKKYSLYTKWDIHKVREFYMLIKQNLISMKRKTHIKWGNKSMRMSKNNILFNVL